MTSSFDIRSETFAEILNEDSQRRLFGRTHSNGICIY